MKLEAGSAKLKANKKAFSLKLSPQELSYGGLAQLARAPALHAGGQRFESVILHAVKREAKSKKHKAIKSFQL